MTNPLFCGIMKVRDYQQPVCLSTHKFNIQNT
nr:MAG TPA: Ribonucleotide reductase inhibitor [Caudoviricetes sp.]